MPSNVTNQYPQKEPYEKDFISHYLYDSLALRSLYGQDNGSELSGAAKFQLLIFAHPAASASARDCVKSPIFPASTGQCPTIYTGKIVFTGSDPDYHVLYGNFLPLIIFLPTFHTAWRMVRQRKNHMVASSI